MEKLPFFIHGMSISDQAAAGNVGAEHRLRRAASNVAWFSVTAYSVEMVHDCNMTSSPSMMAISDFIVPPKC
jgi:hypothetical protein